jgi:ubiquinone/menaquinone biosynthesis C-methylase UbiE
VSDDLLGDSKAHFRSDQAYALWAGTYDSTPNAVLSLEERYLRKMLPPLEGREILDLGCGTGRLLRHVSSARSYVGIDRSLGMLAQGAGKLRASSHLLQADCLNLPLPSESADVVVGSFLLGYVDLVPFAAELMRVSKPGTELYLSEFHPDGLALGWKRRFRSGDQVIELRTRACSPNEVERVFRYHGFDSAHRVEPTFGQEEYEIFVANRKQALFESIRRTRAIFICHLTRVRHGV